MHVQLHDGDEHYKIVRSRLDSGEWWTIISFSADPKTSEAMEFIERQFYSGEASEDFELCLAGLAPMLGFIGIGFAKKTRAPAGALARFCQKFGHSKVTKKELQERDILVFASTKDYYGVILNWFNTRYGSYELPAKEEKPDE